MKDTFTGKKIIVTLTVSVFLTALTPLLLFAFPAAPGAVQHFFKNVFFVNVTFIGDGVFAFSLVFSLLFFLNRKDLSLRLLITVMASLLMVQFIKNLLSSQGAHIYFEAGGVDNSPYRNIISSHTAIAFTLAGFFSLHTKSGYFRVLLFLVAVAVAYSRIYLAAESITTVAAGILPAFLSVLFAYRISFYRRARRSMYKRRAERQISPQHLFPA